MDAALVLRVALAVLVVAFATWVVLALAIVLGRLRYDIEPSGGGGAA